MEQKTKKYDELNKYERAIVNATFEQKLEAIANDLKQMAMALGMSIHVDANFHGEQAQGDDNGSYVSVNVFLPGKTKEETMLRRADEEGALFGAIEEAKNMRKAFEY